MKQKQAGGPQFVSYFGPLLDALRALGGSATPDEAVERVAQDLRVPNDVLDELLPSGAPRFRNRVAWARFYLVREGLIDSSKRGVWSLTERGLRTKLSASEAQKLFSKWAQTFRAERRGNAESESPPREPATPRDGSIEPGYREAALEVLLKLPPAGFERLAQRILREAGFTQVIVTGKSGDGGIDGYGTLHVNPLVSFKVLFQCKRYEKSVSAPLVRNFRGAMLGRSYKGILLTTGVFTADARREAARDGAPPIELVDREKLIDMLERLELGLRRVTTYELDRSFFAEFEA